MKIFLAVIVGSLFAKYHSKLNQNTIHPSGFSPMVKVKRCIFSFKDAVTFDSAAKQKVFYFNNYLQLIYQNANAKVDYLLANHLPKYLKMKQTSDAFLLSDDPLIIEKDGSYFNPMNLMSSGYWGWYKLAEMLPTDYKPGE